MLYKFPGTLKRSCLNPHLISKFWRIQYKLIFSAKSNQMTISTCNNFSTSEKLVFEFQNENINVCLFVYMGFFLPLENFSLIWRRHHYRWRATNFELSSTLMAIKQWGLFSVPHLLWHGASFKMVISEDPWHSHLSQSLFLRLTSVAAGIRSPNLSLAGRSL